MYYIANALGNLGISYIVYRRGSHRNNLDRFPFLFLIFPFIRFRQRRAGSRQEVSLPFQRAEQAMGSSDGSRRNQVEPRKREGTDGRSVAAGRENLQVGSTLLVL